MDLHFDKRVIVLPVDNLMGHFSNHTNYRYNNAVRRNIVLLTIQDLLERANVVEWHQPLNYPEGRRGLNFWRFATNSDRNAALHVQNQKTVELFAKRLLAAHSLYEACVADDAVKRNIVEPGFQLSWANRKEHHLLITWIRPRLDYVNLTVAGFLSQVSTILIEQRKLDRGKVADFMQSTPLNQLLTDRGPVHDDSVGMALGYLLDYAEKTIRDKT